MNTFPDTPRLDLYEAVQKLAKEYSVEEVETIVRKALADYENGVFQL